MITVKQLKEFLEICPEDAIIKTTNRFDTDGSAVEAKTMTLTKAGSVAIESGWDD